MTADEEALVGSGPDGIIVPRDLEDPDWFPEVGKEKEGRMEERILSRLDHVVELVARMERMSEERVVERVDTLGIRLSGVEAKLAHEASKGDARETILEGMRLWLESRWERYMKGSDRAEAAFEEVGRKLDRLSDDSWELRRRVSPAGRAGAGLSGAFLGGLISCALLAGLAVAGGLVEVRWATPGDKPVAGERIALREDADRTPPGTRLDNMTMVIPEVPLAPGSTRGRQAERLEPQAVAPSVMPDLAPPPGASAGDGE